MKMRSHLLVVGLAILTLAGCCSPNANQVGKILEEHPEILASAIEKHPDVFMEAVQKAAQSAQAKAQEKSMKEEQARVEQEFKTPLDPEVKNNRGFLGPQSAPITIVEYTDFQCPFCSRSYVTVEQVRKAYGEKVKVLVKNFPLSMHPLAMPAAKRFEAIRAHSPEQAYAFYHEVFSHPEKISEGESFLDSVVKKVGANLAQVKKEMDSESVKSIIQSDMAEAEKFGFTGTPGFIVAGVSIRGAYPFNTFKDIIDKKLAQQ